MKPATGETVIVYVAVWPRVIVIEDGVTAMVKSGRLTTSVTVVW